MSLEKPLSDHLMDQTPPFQPSLYTLPHFISFKILISIWNFIKIFFCLYAMVCVSYSNTSSGKLGHLSGSPGLPCACKNIRYAAGTLKYLLDKEVYSGSGPVISTEDSELNKLWSLARRLSCVGLKTPSNFWKRYYWSSFRGWLICHHGESMSVRDY